MAKELYRVYCEFPLNDEAVFVMADSPQDASANVRTILSITHSVKPSEVLLYNCWSESEVLDSAVQDPIYGYIYGLFCCGGGLGKPSYLKKANFFVPAEHPVRALWKEFQWSAVFKNV